MDLRDRDLISIQEARDSVARASAAQKKFAAFSQQQIDTIVETCAGAASAAGESLARLAVEETGFGNVPDKTTKNRLASVDVPRAMVGMRTVGVIREDRDKGIVEIASPVGVVAAVIPSTNPTSTAIYKTLISLKSGNAIVMSPHPSAVRCICETATLLERAAASAGAPEGLINCMKSTTLAGTRELMSHRDVGVILATGGTGLVRAAYGSGKPAYGVGPGNVPAFIERTADVRKAIADIFAGKTFDYGTICSSEQAIVVEEAVREAALDQCREQGAYFLTAEEAQKLGALVFHGGTHTPNTNVVGRPATTIAELAGIRVPASTRVLIARLEPEQVGKAFPLSAEKLSPILAFYSVANLAAGTDVCQRLLAFGGLGHTCAIHSQNDSAIRQFGKAIPAFRICVNTSAVHGSIGYSTNLFPAMTLGCGAPGGNITSDNIGPQHLMNVKRVAWGVRPVEHRSVPASQRMATTVNPEAAKTASVAAPAPSAAAISRPPVPAVGTEMNSQSAPIAAPPKGIDRAQIASLVEKVLVEYKLATGNRAVFGSAVSSPTAGKAATLAQPLSHVPGESANHSPSQIASELASRVFGRATEPNTGISASRSSEPAPSAFEPPAPPAPVPPKNITVSPFVSENDVRRAVTRQEKIYIGPKTILTPSARDLGTEHEVFVEVPATNKG